MRTLQPGRFETWFSVGGRSEEDAILDLLAQSLVYLKFVVVFWCFSPPKWKNYSLRIDESKADGGVYVFQTHMQQVSAFILIYYVIQAKLSNSAPGMCIRIFHSEAEDAVFRDQIVPFSSVFGRMADPVIFSQFHLAQH